MSAPDYIHKLIDLAWFGGNLEVNRHAVPGNVWSVGHAGRWFTVDFRDGEQWTVTIAQEQPPINPALVLTLDEYMEEK